MTGVARAVIDAASSASWWKFIPGLNMLLNVGFFVWDMKGRWESGGKEMSELLETRFWKESQEIQQNNCNNKGQGGAIRWKCDNRPQEITLALHLSLLC